jgi:hypothetical protein
MTLVSDRPVRQREQHPCGIDWLNRIGLD